MGPILFILKAAFLLVVAAMTFLILLQEGSGGGLAALGGTRASGVEGVTNPVRRATGYLAAVWFILAIVLGAVSSRQTHLAAPIGSESECACGHQFHG